MRIHPTVAAQSIGVCCYPDERQIQSPQIEITEGNSIRKTSPLRERPWFRKLGCGLVTGWAVTCTHVGPWLVNSTAKLVGIVPKSYSTGSNSLSTVEQWIRPSLASNTRSKTPTDNYSNLITHEDVKNKTFDGKICRAFVPKEPKGKPLYVLILGHVEELDWPSHCSGIVHFYENLVKEARGTVLLFRTGLVTDEISNMISFTYEPQYKPNIVFDQTKNILHHFIKNLEPSELRMAGYSWGGGTIEKLSEDDSWREGIPVERTVMIDPIFLGALNLGAPLRTRPCFTNSPRHLNFHVFQRNNNLSLLERLFTLQGDYPKEQTNSGRGEGDVIKYVHNTSHLGIDDTPDVRREGYEFLTSTSFSSVKLAKK